MIRQKTRWSEEAYFPYIYIENFKNLPETNGPVSVQFGRNVFFKIVQAIICRKARPPSGVTYFPYISVWKASKTFLSETTNRFK